MRSSDLPNELVDRGIHWQIAGFLLVACVGVAVLAEFAGSDHRVFMYFEIAATKLYWALVIPLAGLFDGARKMFEKMSEIRAKRRQRWLDEGRQEGRQQERARLRAEVQRLGAALSPEVVASLLDEPDNPSEQRDAHSV